MSANQDELSSSRRSAMRALLVEHARRDIAGSARTSRGRLLSVIAGAGLVTALAAGAVAITVTGLPLFPSAPAPVATGTGAPTPTVSPEPTPTATPTPIPSPPPESDGATPTIPPGAPEVPPTVAEFQSAVIAAGLECDTLAPLGDVRDDVVDGAVCEPSLLRLAVFADDAGVPDVLARNDASLERQRILYGDRWIASVDDVFGQSDDLISLQSVLGGTLNWVPAAPTDGGAEQ